MDKQAREREEIIQVQRSERARERENDLMGV
jgi:hypothetical protein